MSKINNAQKALLGLLGQNLFASPFTPDADTDWAAVLQESKMQAVVLVAFNNYKCLPIDAETKAALEKKLKQNTMNNIFCFKYHAYLHELMVKHGIPYCVLKGAASAQYYPDPLLRAMGDVDFYVHPKDIDQAIDVFKNEDFAVTGTDHQIHVTLRKERMHFEMHFAPITLFDGEVKAIIDEYWQDICESSIQFADALTCYKGPSAFHHCLILLLHFQQHLVAEGIGLRHLCDWAVFANSYANEEFCSLFEQKLKNVGLWKLAQLLSLIAVEHLGMPHKDWMGSEFSTANELMTDILASGNFGRKDYTRSGERFFISNFGTNVKENRFVLAIKSLNRIVDKHWNLPKRIPLLYPVGWIYFTARYGIRFLLGKRKINVADAYLKSGIRKEIYKKLNLFEPEK